MKDIKNINIDTKELLEALKYSYKEIVIFICLLIVFVFGLNFAWNKFMDMQSKLNEAKRLQEVYLSKVATLADLTSILPEEVLLGEEVLPSKNPAILGINQVKSLAFQLEVEVSNIKAGTTIKGESGISRSTVDFEAIAPRQVLYAYIDAFSKALPLMKVDKVKMNRLGENYSANITLLVFSAEIPKQIPALNAPAASLTAAEINTLKSLSEYILPRYSIQEDFVPNLERQDPFN